MEIHVQLPHPTLPNLPENRSEWSGILLSHFPSTVAFSDKRERHALAPPQAYCCTPLRAVKHCAAPNTETTENTVFGDESRDDRSQHPQVISAADFGDGAARPQYWAGNLVEERGPETHGGWALPATLIYFQTSLKKKAC